MATDPDVAERVRMALAEAGYPDARVVSSERYICRMLPPIPPPAIVWRAAAVAGDPSLLCWPCWRDYALGDPDCTHDPLTSEWPPVPGRPT